MEWKICYPDGKRKALTFSYDDGKVQDRRLVALFNAYGMKATFHLNSGLFGPEEENIHPWEAAGLYQGHEVACHGVRHHDLTHLGTEALATELWEDRRALERLTGYPVTGHSYAFGRHSPAVVRVLEALGFEYSRTVDSTGGFAWPENFLLWHPTCHHNEELLQRAEEFLHPPAWRQLPLLYVWGHSFEFEREQNWGLMEEFCVRLAGQPDVWYATNQQVRRYIGAARRLQTGVEGHLCHNPSGVGVFLRRGAELVCIPPGETWALR